MDETKNRGTENGSSGNTNTSTSDKQRTVGSGSGNTNTGKQDQKDIKIPVVEQGSPAEVTVEINAETKADQKAVPKKKKPPLKKKITPKERSEAEKVKDIQGLLEGVFMVASLKAGSHWVLTSDESKQIAVPLSRILDRYDLLGKASEVSDPVALIVAVATIVFPKVILTKMENDQKKKNVLEKNGVLTNANEKRSNTSDGGSNAGSTKTTDQSNDGQFIKSLHTEV